LRKNLKGLGYRVKMSAKAEELEVQYDPVLYLDSDPIHKPKGPSMGRAKVFWEGCHEAEG
jgi:hypothetical protein